MRRDHGRARVERGAPRGPVRCLDALPDPAYEHFYDDKQYRELPIRTFLGTRGCPFRCTYRFNRTLNDRYRQSGLQPYPGTELSRWVVEQGHFHGDFDRLGYSYFDPSPFRFEDPRHRDRITNLPRLFSLAVEFPEIRKRMRQLIEREPNRLYRFLFTTRHDWMMRRVVYAATRIGPCQEVGTTDLLEAARRDLGLLG